MTELYRPKDSEQLVPAYQLRVALQGNFGTGKSRAALTFKNPVYANLDRNVPAEFAAREDIINLPFHNGIFCDKYRMRNPGVPQKAPNRKDAFLEFLRGEATKLSTEQTLIVDSYRQVEIAFHVQYDYDKQPNKQGVFNPFEEWRQKIEYFQELGVYYKELKCDVIVCVHEVPDRNEEGKIVGIKPALSGQSGDTLGTDFTDYYRSIAIAKPKPEHAQMFIQQWGISQLMLNDWMASTKTDTIYIWQTQSDSTVKCKCSLIGAPKFLIANSSSIEKYRTKQTT